MNEPDPWKPPVPDHGACIIGRDGHFHSSVALDCADDEAAIVAAKQSVDGHDVELWQRDRKIAKLDRVCATWRQIMNQNSDRQELERRLEQSRRLALAAADPTTKDRLAQLVRRRLENGSYGRERQSNICAQIYNRIFEVRAAGAFDNKA